MPVFVAFGWAGEENAIKYALSQLQQFIELVYVRLPSNVRDEFPYHGLSMESQNVYLATAEDYTKEVFVVFNARPTSLELQLGIVDKAMLTKGLAFINKDPVAAHNVLTQLDSNWTLRLQQMQVDAETGERAHHLDLFKDSVSALTEEQAREIFERAAYLNQEEKWVTPFYLSTRVQAERVAAMGLSILDIAADLVASLLPVAQLFTGRKPKKTRQKTKAKKAAATPEEEAAGTGEQAITASVKAMADGFTYVAELKPLHIRRGFVNLTPAHWPFFASSPRTETRNVTVVFGGRQERSSVWRLQPDDQARLVLSPPVHDWLEENFAASDAIRVTARRLEKDEIRITLESAD